MIASNQGATSGPGVVRSCCNICGWRRLTIGLTGSARWAKAQRHLEGHLEADHPDYREDWKP